MSAQGLRRGVWHGWQSAWDTRVATACKARLSDVCTTAASGMGDLYVD